MIVDITPEALAYLLSREKAHNAPPGATGGAGGPHMAVARADMAWQRIGCRVLVVAPETPASDLAGIAARGAGSGASTAPPRTCTACAHHREDDGEWGCPLDAYEWAHNARMGLTETEWPPGVPACPAFRVRT